MSPYPVLFVCFAIASTLAAIVGFQAQLSEAYSSYCSRLEVHFSRLFIQIEASKVARILLIGTAIVALVIAITVRLYLAVAIMAFTLLVPLLLLGARAHRRLEAFEGQLPDALRSLANGIKAGLVLPRAIGLIEENMAAPASQEFGLVLRRYQLGSTIDDALTAMGERLRSPTLDLALTALQVGRKAGGDMARVMDGTASAIEQIQRLEQKIKLATAQGKLQAWVMAFMPPTFAVIVYQIDQTLILPLFQDPIGWFILGGICILEMIGVFMIRKLMSVQI